MTPDLRTANPDKFKPPFRVGRHQSRAVLDSTGMEVLVFPKGMEQWAVEYCEFLNREKVQKPDTLEALTGKTVDDLEQWRSKRNHLLSIETGLEVDQLTDRGKLNRVQVIAPNDALNAMDEARKEGLREACEVYDKYIKLLGEELDELSGMAFVHGWRSRRVKEGEEGREKINKLKASINEQ